MEEIVNDKRKIYYSMGEVAEMFDVNASLIRFWEKKFDILKPHKNKKGNRLFTPQDVDNLKLIYHLVKEKGMTLAGAKKRLKEDRKGTIRDLEIADRLLAIKAMLVDIREELKSDGEIIPPDGYLNEEYTGTEGMRAAPAAGAAASRPAVEKPEDIPGDELVVLTADVRTDVVTDGSSPWDEEEQMPAEAFETGGDASGETGDASGEPGGETGSETGGETGSDAGGDASGETGGETGGDAGGEMGGETGSIAPYIPGYDGGAAASGRQEEFEEDGEPVDEEQRTAAMEELRSVKNILAGWNDTPVEAEETIGGTEDGPFSDESAAMGDDAKAEVDDSILSLDDQADYSDPWEEVVEEGLADPQSEEPAAGQGRTQPGDLFGTDACTTFSPDDAEAGKEKEEAQRPRIYEQTLF